MRSAEELFAIEKWPPKASAVRRPQRFLECRCRQRSGGWRGSARETTLWRNIGRPRGADWSSQIIRIARDSCVCTVGLMIKSGCVLAKMLVAGTIADTPCCTGARVRKRLQASGMERGCRSVQMLMMAGRWPAKQVIFGDNGELFYYFPISATFVGEESALDGSKFHRQSPHCVMPSVLTPFFVAQCHAELFGVFSMTCQCLLVCVSMPYVGMAARPAQPSVHEDMLKFACLAIVFSFSQFLSHAEIAASQTGSTRRVMVTAIMGALVRWSQGDTRSSLFDP